MTQPDSSSPRAELALWLRFEEQLRAASTVERLRAVAAELPWQLAQSPDAQLVQSRVMLRAWAHRVSARVPAWTERASAGVARLTWARFTLLVDPDGFASSSAAPYGLPWRALLHGLDWRASPDPSRLLAMLARAPHAEPCRSALAGLRDAVVEGVVPIDLASAIVSELLVSDDASRRVLAWQLASERWASLLPIPPGTFRRSLSSDDEMEVLAAAEAAGVRDDWSSLVPLLTSPLTEVRRAAVRWAGAVGDRSAIRALLDAALADRQSLADVALGALTLLQHRGAFVQPDDAGDVLALLSSGVEVPAGDVAGVLFVARREVVAHLRTLGADDPDWLHLVPVAAAMARAPRAPLGLIDELGRVAADSDRPLVVRQALSALREAAVDDVDGVSPSALCRVALARLSTFPEEALALLEAVADDGALDELATRLGFSDGGVPAPELAGHADRALSLLWQASSPARRAVWAARVSPERLPWSVISSMSFGSPTQVDIVRLHAGVSDVDLALAAWCEVAQPDELPALTVAVLRVAERAAARSVNPPPRRLEDGPPAPYGEAAQTLPAPVVTAFDAMAKRWCTAGVVRPACILAGPERVLAHVVVGLLRSPQPSAVTAVLLRTLLSRQHPSATALAATLIEHDDPNVAKLAARLLARHGAAWMALHLRRGLRDDDERRVRACVDALASTEGDWVAEALLDCLRHPNMNIKKSAAGALARLATPRCAALLLEMLGREDNPGLRAALLLALERALGGGTVAAIVAALRLPGVDARTQTLLVDALDGRLTAGFVRTAAAQGSAWGRELLAQLASRRVKLRTGTLQSLESELRAAGLSPALDGAPAVDALARAVDDLFIDGWNDSRVDAVLSRTPVDRGWHGPMLARLRSRSDAWLHWMIARRDLRPASIVAAALADGPSVVERRAVLQVLPALVDVFGQAQLADRTMMFPLLQRVAEIGDALQRIHVGLAIRASLDAPPDASALALLTGCGLVITRDDLDRALRGVADVADPAAFRRRLLADAFFVAPTPLAHEGPAERLSNALRSGATALRAQRQAWELDDATTLRALAYELPSSPPEVWSTALDWMESLRPVGAADWPIEQRTHAGARRLCRPRDHEEQLRSLALWLESPEDRAGTAGSAPTTEMIQRFSPDELLPLVHDDDAALCRLAPLLHAASWPARFPEHVRALDVRFERGTDTLRRALEPLLRPDRPAPRSVVWSSTARMEAERAWGAMWTTPICMPAASTHARSELGSPDGEVVRRALSSLASAPGEDWPDILRDMASDVRPRVRAHALRLARKTLPKELYVELASTFLGDAIPDLRRSAIRAVSHAHDTAASPRIAALLEDSVPWVRAAALEGLRRLGDSAIQAVRRARDRARPDVARDVYAPALALLVVGSG